MKLLRVYVTTMHLNELSALTLSFLKIQYVPYHRHSWRVLEAIAESAPVFCSALPTPNEAAITIKTSPSLLISSKFPANFTFPLPSIVRRVGYHIFAGFT